MPIMTLDPSTGSASPSSPLYRFSGSRVDQLDATEYTLVTVVVDLSGSVSRFRDGIVRCLDEIAAACRRSPRAANLMLRVTAFQSHIQEVHGFLPVQSIAADRYAGLTTGGCTALYDAAANAIAATARYGADLGRSCIDVNGLCIVITDGADNASTLGVGAVAAALREAVHSEALESMRSMLVGVAIDDPATARTLQDVQRDAGLDLFLRLEDADAASLARLASFVSRSVSAQSVALGTGSAGPVLRF